MKLGTALIMSGAGIPTVPGTPFGGGFYVGRMIDPNGVKYALILAPKGSGESGNRTAFTSTNAAMTSLLSDWDGASNTAAMLADNRSPIATFTANMTIGGFTDWFIPARYQLELCYRNLKRSTTANDLTGDGVTSNQYAYPNTPAYTASNPAQTSRALFQSGGSEAFEDDNYWTSSPYPSTEAWYQDMNAGGLRHGSKTVGHRVRAVRMIKI